MVEVLHLLPHPALHPRRELPARARDRGAVAVPLTVHRRCARETMSLPVQNPLSSVDKRLATLSVRCVVGRVVYEHLRKIMQGFHAAWRIHTVEFRKEVSLCLYLPPMSFPIRR